MAPIIRDFLLFLRHPVLIEPDVLSLKRTINFIVKSIGIYVIFTLFYVAIVAILCFWFDLKVTEFSAKKRYFFNFVILAPIIEELIFRLPLRNFFKNIFISVGLLTFVIVKGYVPLLIAILLGLVVALLPYATKLTKEIEENVNSFVVRYFGYLFYFLAISFGILHILSDC